MSGRPFLFRLLLGREVVFAYAAQRAHKVFGQFFPDRAGGDPVVGLSECLVIDLSAHVAYVLHNDLLLRLPHR